MIDKIFLEDTWIMDGNYQRTLEMRINACDTIILLDFNLEVSLEGETSRVGQQRDDMPWKEESLSELSSDEWIELGIIEKELERICKKLFNATMFNFACLMNNAYRDDEAPKVHYHFVPRYKNELKLFGKVYEDRHFGYNFWKWNLSKFKAQKDPYTEDDRKKIFDMMKEEWSL